MELRKSPRPKHLGSAHGDVDRHTDWSNKRSVVVTRVINKACRRGMAEHVAQVQDTISRPRTDAVNKLWPQRL
jgi:hypothetical protein